MASSISNRYCSNFLRAFNAVKDYTTVTDKYIVFIQPAVVFHFLEDFIVEPAKLKYKGTQHRAMEKEYCDQICTVMKFTLLSVIF